MRMEAHTDAWGVMSGCGWSMSALRVALSSYSEL